jgi:hypothetical protein
MSMQRCVCRWGAHGSLLQRHVSVNAGGEREEGCWLREVWWRLFHSVFSSVFQIEYFWLRRGAHAAVVSVAL